MLIAKCTLKIFLRMLSLRRQFFSARSACVGNFLAHTLSMRKKTKWRISPVVFEKKKKIPVLKSPTQIGFIGVKKWGKNLTLGHL
jgi:hypothetical protein